jgi:4-hydroxy-tetrahydrodipicolinate reductase
MKIAVIGKGKTGGHLLPLIPTADCIGPFGKSNPPTPENLQPADVGVVFVPGDAFLELLPLLLESKKPMVIGATGMEWPKDLDQELTKRGSAWVHATNFSLGVQLFRQLIKTANRLQSSLPHFTAALLDIHHTKKLDAPSGTAKSLAAWSDFPVEISARREGDVVGFHELTLTFPQETIKISHNAHDRALFAQGALDVAKLWIKKPLGDGLHPLEHLMDHLEKHT